MNNTKKIIDEYLEALRGFHEIEFDYKDSGYCIEPRYDGTDGYNISKFSKDRSSKGTTIATIKTPEEIIELKCFDGKTLAEIVGDIDNGIIF